MLAVQMEFCGRLQSPFQSNLLWIATERCYMIKSPIHNLIPQGFPWYLVWILIQT